MSLAAQARAQALTAASTSFSAGFGAAVAGATKKDFFGDGNKARLIVTLSKTL